MICPTLQSAIIVSNAEVPNFSDIKNPCLPENLHTGDGVGIQRITVCSKKQNEVIWTSIS